MRARQSAQKMSTIHNTRVEKTKNSKNPLSSQESLTDRSHEQFIVILQISDTISL